MNFTREPIIETIITPREGYKLVLRNSKTAGHEEHFVDSIQVVSLGQTTFYCSVEKPKSFLLPASDYEIVETRETRVVLKTPGIEKGGIKIGGGRETQKGTRDASDIEEVSMDTEEAPSQEKKGDRKKEKGKFRKKKERLREETRMPSEEQIVTSEQQETPRETHKAREERHAALIPPPPTLISETLAKYRHTPSFASAFYENQEEQVTIQEQEDEPQLNFDPNEVLDFLVEEVQQEIPEDEDTV